MVPAVVGARGPTHEESCQEDHRDDKYNARDDADPRQDLTEAVRPLIAVAVRRLLECRGRSGPRIRSFQSCCQHCRAHTPPG